MPNSLSPVKNKTLADRCYERIKDAILSLDLHPNAPLDEAEIASQLNVSKTPIREALARLTGEQLVVVRPDRRSYVADLSIDLIKQIFQVRVMLETASIRETGSQLDDHALGQIKDSIDATQLALDRDDLPGFLDASGAFHRLMIAQSGNAFLIDLAGRLFEHSRRTTAAMFRLELSANAHPMSKHGVEMHQRIYEALLDHDGERAAALLSEDILSMLSGATSAELSGRLASLRQQLNRDSETQ